MLRISETAWTLRLHLIVTPRRSIDILDLEHFSLNIDLEVCQDFQESSSRKVPLTVILRTGVAAGMLYQGARNVGIATSIQSRDIGH